MKERKKVRSIWYDVIPIVPFSKDWHTPFLSPTHCAPLKRNLETNNFSYQGKQCVSHKIERRNVFVEGPIEVYHKIVERGRDKLREDKE